MQQIANNINMLKEDCCHQEKMICGGAPSVITPKENYRYKNDHTSVTELMWGLHWLPIRARIQYKILLLVYKVFTNGSSTYLADMMTSCNPVRSTAHHIK